MMMMLPTLSLAGKSSAGRPRSLLQPQTTGRLLVLIPYHHHTSVAATTRHCPLTTCRVPFQHHQLQKSWSLPLVSPAAVQISLQRQGRVCLSTTTAATASTSSSSSSNKSTSDSGSISSISNLILDHLGSIFLTAIGLVIATLVRSYYGTARKNALRDRLEAEAALDPLEMNELRLANPRFTANVFRSVMEALWNKQEQQHQQQQHDDNDASSLAAGVPTMTYSEFCVAVREILQTQHHTDENPIPTIELGHYLDRVVLKLLSSSSSSSDQPQSLTLWLVVLSLALSGPIQDRIQVLYEILQRQAMATTRRDEDDLDDLQRNRHDDSTTCNQNIVTVAQVHELVGYLQSTCQLVIDNQLLATPEKKYPIQDYHQGSPQELVQWTTNQPPLSPGDGSSSSSSDQSEKDKREHETIDVHALAAILRSKSVCAWGECYHKKKMI